MAWADVVDNKKCDGSCGWKEALEHLDEMLDLEQYEYAYDFLTGVEKFIKKNKHVTPKQKQAIGTIRRKPSEDRSDHEEYGGFGWGLGEPE